MHNIIIMHGSFHLNYPCCKETCSCYWYWCKIWKEPMLVGLQKAVNNFVLQIMLMSKILPHPCILMLSARFLQLQVNEICSWPHEFLAMEDSMNSSCPWNKSLLWDINLIFSWMGSSLPMRGTPGCLVELLAYAFHQTINKILMCNVTTLVLLLEISILALWLGPLLLEMQTQCMSCPKAHAFPVC